MPQIESWEDRGMLKDTHPESCYGYVYFDDGSRVGFALGLNANDVWEPRTNGGGQFRPVTVEQLKAAIVYLREQGLPVRNYEPEI